MNQTDHDLLVTLNQKVTYLKVSVKDLQDGTFAKIAMLEKDKADRKDVEALQHKINNDMEIRVRKVEDRTSKYLITITLYSIAVGTMIGLIIYHILQK